VGFPWWTTFPERATSKTGNQYESGERKVLNLALAQKDPNVWGADAAKFRLRPFKSYHDHFVGFADFAYDDGVAQGKMNRNCPAKTLAIAMGTAWLEAWHQEEWCTDDKPSWEDITPFVGDFVLRQCGATCGGGNNWWAPWACEMPLGLGDGDCDSDTDCIGRLKCGSNNCGDFHDLTWWRWWYLPSNGFDGTDDCCYDPAPDTPPTLFRENDTAVQEAAAAEWAMLQSGGQVGSASAQLKVLQESLDLDPRFDLYSRAVAIGFFYVAGFYVVPGANVVTVASDTWDVPYITAGLGGMLVPKTDENFEDVRVKNAVALQLHGFGLLNAIPAFPTHADSCGDWERTENPAQIINAQLLPGVWPTSRVLEPWGTEIPCGLAEDEELRWSAYRYTTSALEALVFEGVGQHRIVRIQDDASAPTNAYYAVYLGFMDSLETRPGFAKLGCDAYFDRDGRALAIRRQGKTYTPDGPAGTGKTCRWDYDGATWSWERRCSGWSDGWLHAAMSFRGSLMAAVTFLDHLHGLHLVAANSVITSVLEHLEPSHPLRRLLTPFSYRTSAINYNAATALIPEMGLVPRAVGLTDKGLTDVFRYGNATLIAFEPIPQLKAKKGVDTVTLPLDEDGIEYYEIIKSYVHEYLSHYYDYGTNACKDDPQVVAWHARVDSMTPPRSDLPPSRKAARRSRPC